MTSITCFNEDTATPGDYQARANYCRCRLLTVAPLAAGAAGSDGASMMLILSSYAILCEAFTVVTPQFAMSELIVQPSTQIYPHPAALMSALQRICAICAEYSSEIACFLRNSIKKQRGEVCYAVSLLV